MSDTIFTRILAGETADVFIYEDKYCVVVMDAFPSVPGQTLIIARIAIDRVADLPEDVSVHMFKVAMHFMRASDKAFGARTCMVVEGNEVPHAHIKLYPKIDGRGVLFGHITKGERADAVELEKQAERLRVFIDPLSM